MKIKHPKSGKYLDIYSARLTFKKEKNNISNRVYVTVYYKKTIKKKKDFSVPKDIDFDELNWEKGRTITVYYRTIHRTRNIEDYDYVDSRGITVPTNLSQKLEDLVNITCFKNSEEK